MTRPKVEEEYFKELASVLKHSDMRVVTNVHDATDCYVEFTFHDFIESGDLQAINAFFNNKYFYISVFEDQACLSVKLRGKEEE